MSAEVDYTYMWDKCPVELDGWVLAHRMLIADQQKLKDLLSALLTQTEAGVALTDQQRSALTAFFHRYEQTLHHHHDNEEKIAFPYLYEVKKAVVDQKFSADHKTILAALDNCSKLLDSVVSDAGNAQNEAVALKKYLEAFTALDEALTEHYYEEEQLIKPMRRLMTPAEQAKNITKPIVGGMTAMDRGQYFGKLSPETLKAFMRIEKIPFFAKYIFRANARKYAKTYEVPVDEAMAYARTAVGENKEAISVVS